MFCDCFFLSKMALRLIHVAVGVRISFFFKTKCPVVWADHVKFIRSPVGDDAGVAPTPWLLWTTLL